MKIEVVRTTTVKVFDVAAEEYTRTVFKTSVNIGRLFNFAAITNELALSKWTDVMPIFIPRGVDNRMAVDSLTRGVFKEKTLEDVDVMLFRGSAASDKHRLFLIDLSHEPDHDTLNKSPNDLLKIGGLWLPLKGYAIAQGLYYRLTGGKFDTGTFTWFPGETLIDKGKTARANWSRELTGGVHFDAYNSDGRFESFGARRAIEVPIMQ